ncbi:MAG: peptidoglycan-binding domain-containing protein [Candidatus Paceibacterota bacterium]
MKIKIFTTLLVLSFFITNTAFALTQADVEFLIKAGFIPTDKIATARAAVSATSNTTNTTSSTSNTSSASYNTVNTNFTEQNGCLKLGSDLFNGTSGTAVSALQKFLKDQGHYTYGEITGFFGNVTQSAVESFQKAQGIVLNGTPSTTGLGKVGPTTRSFIEKISCGTSSGTATESKKDFFGYNLDELFNYSPDLNYSKDFEYDTSFEYENFSNYDVDSSYEADTGYDVGDYEVDFDYDVDSSYSADSGYSTGLKDVSVGLFVKAVNGQFLRGGNKLPVAVSSNRVELKWNSTNADTCSLSGNFQERSMSVPVDGTANLVVINASYTASNGDPMYSLKINCFSNSSGYTFPASDTALIWIAPAPTTPAQ